MKAKQLATAVLLLFFVFFVMVSVWFFFRFDFFSPGGRVWKRYYTVIFRGDGNKKLLIERLRKYGYLGDVASVYTSPVMFYDFSGFKWVVIDKLDRYLDREDPRYDNYLKNARNFFVAFSQKGIYEILYFPSNERPLLAYLKLRKLFRGTDILWYFLDFSPIISFLSILFFLGFSFFIVKGWKYPRTVNSSGRYFISLGVIPWVLVMFDGDIIVTGFAFVLFPIYVSLSTKVCESVDGYLHFDRKIDRKRKNEWMGELSFFMGVLLFVFIFLIMVKERFFSILPVLWVLGFDLMLVGLMVSVVWGERFIYSHDVFRPVRILGDFFIGEQEGHERKFLLFAVGVFLVFGGGMFAVKGYYGNFIIPQPRKFYVQKGLSKWQQFDSLWKTNRELKIPNVADYIAHRAYQETLQFKYADIEEKMRKDWFPVENSTLCLREFYYDRYKNKIFGRKIVVKHFDENWLKGILLEIKNNSFEKIIERQGKITTVDYFPMKKLPYWKWYSLEFIVLIIVLIYYLFFFNRKWFFSTKTSYDFGGLYEES